MRKGGEILVVSCYELGRQPVALASALAELERAGFHPAAQDVSLEPLDHAAVSRARLVAIAVPMHTALRLGVRVAAKVRALNPDAHIAFFGLYAALNAQHLLSAHGDSAIGGESAAPLRTLAEALERGPLAGPLPGVATSKTPHAEPALRRERKDELLPSRGALPVLSRYAHLDQGDGAHVQVASVEATRGCKHLCRHCPLVPVYRGRFVAVPEELVLADIAQQIDAGAGHVSFGDPDFWNGPTHARRIVRALHERWPHVSFDATIKIEHLLQHRALLPELAQAGCLFITSAVESLSDRVLAALDKGHTATQVPEALRLVRDAGIDLRPTLLPYTPWTALGDLPQLFDFAEEHELLEQIDPVQYTLRLLIPAGSAILDGGEARPWLGAFDEAGFSWKWTHPDARVDALWAESSALARERAGEDALETFAQLRALAERATAREPRWVGPPLARARKKVPRLTEPWFC